MFGGNFLGGVIGGRNVQGQRPGAQQNPQMAQRVSFFKEYLITYIGCESIPLPSLLDRISKRGIKYFSPRLLSTSCSSWSAVEIKIPWFSAWRMGLRWLTVVSCSSSPKKDFATFPTGCSECSNFPSRELPQQSPWWPTWRKSMDTLDIWSSYSPIRPNSSIWRTPKQSYSISWETLPVCTKVIRSASKFLMINSRLTFSR